MNQKNPTGVNFLLVFGAVLLLGIVGFFILSSGKQKEEIASKNQIITASSPLAEAPTVVTNLATSSSLVFEDQVTSSLQTESSNVASTPPASSEILTAVRKPTSTSTTVTETTPSTTVASTATTVLTPDKYPTLEGKDFKISKNAAGQAIIDGAIRNCVAVTDLIFSYSSGDTKVEVPINCVSGEGNVYEVLPIQPTGIVHVDIEVRNLEQSFASSKVSVDFSMTATLPAVPANSGEGRRIIYTVSGKRVWMVEADGTIFDSFQVVGKPGIPPPGQYNVFSRSELAFAGHDGITMNNMVRFVRPVNADPATNTPASLSIGFHQVPNNADGTPLHSDDLIGSDKVTSAGCGRLNAHTAKKLFDWVEVEDRAMGNPGTPVVVLP